jgi:hypothetical protein
VVVVVTMTTTVMMTMTMMMMMMMMMMITDITLRKTEGKVQSLLDSTQYHSYVPEDLAQVKIQYTYGQPYMCIQGRTGEIQTPTHGNPINHSITAPPPLLSHSSILPPVFHCALITRKNSGQV